MPNRTGWVFPKNEKHIKDATNTKSRTGCSIVLAIDKLQHRPDLFSFKPSISISLKLQEQKK
ncbi:hypothetical protein QQP08_008244 [Theobroma cacao]|nr:hypothetical protein QQP08_008244 [Theobroma cacao]